MRAVATEDAIALPQFGGDSHGDRFLPDAQMDRSPDHSVLLAGSKAALDEPDSIYCHAAEWVEISPDRNTFTFGLREGTRFHDATPLSAEDVAFSFNLLKEKGHPSLVSGLRAMKAVKALDERTVELVLDGTEATVRTAAC